MQTTHCLGPLLLGDLATLNPNPRSIASGFWSPHHKVSVSPQPRFPLSGLLWPHGLALGHSRIVDTEPGLFSSSPQEIQSYHLFCDLRSICAEDFLCLRNIHIPGTETLATLLPSCFFLYFYLPSSSSSSWYGQDIPQLILAP